MTAAVPAAKQPSVLADLLPGSLVRDVGLVVGGAAFVGLLAQISIAVPGSPVPITGQTFGVLLGGAALGWRRALPSMLLYMVAGLAGVPWFAGHQSGSIHMVTFGYIIGFAVASTLVGTLAARGGDRTPVRAFATMLIGTAVVYLVGVPYLAADLGVSLTKAYNLGMKDYMLGDVLKAALAAGLLPATWKVLRLREQH